MGEKGKDPMQRHSYGPYLLLLHPDQLTVLTMHAVLGNLLGGYFPVNSRRRQDPRGQQYFKQAGRTKLTDVSFKLGQVRLPISALHGKNLACCVTACSASTEEDLYAIGWFSLRALAMRRFPCGV